VSQKNLGKNLANPFANMKFWNKKGLPSGTELGWDIFELDGLGVLEIEADAEAGKFKDDMEATAEVIRKAKAGDPVALRALVHLFAVIARPVIEAAKKRPMRSCDKPLQDLTVVISGRVADTAARAVY
jgi:hypothetical protein